MDRSVFKGQSMIDSKVHKDLEVVAPAVIGAASHEGVAAESSATRVFIPADRVSQGDTEINLALWRLDDGRLALFAYSSLDKLVVGCGSAQPWVAVDSVRMPEVERLAGVDVVLWDTELPQAPVVSGGTP